MSKRPKRRSILMDMTAMCDMAFLLLTYFILTAHMRPAEPAEFNVPSASLLDSVSQKNTVQIAVEKGGRVYLSIGDKILRKRVLETIDERYDLQMSDSEISAFEYTDMFGFAFKDAKAVLNKINDVNTKQYGIPTDTTGGELKEWLLVILEEYEKDPKLLPKPKNGALASPIILIKADKLLPYKDLKTVLEVVQSDGVKIDEYEIVTTSNI
jgi:biopolymer transport protein ExbD